MLETVREILFPEMVGGIHEGSAGSITETPEKLQKHTDHVGNAIKNKREEKGWTQVQLAEASGLPQSHVSRLESGVHSPSFTTLEKIAKALGTSVGDLDPSN